MGAGSSGERLPAWAPASLPKKTTQNLCQYRELRHPRGGQRRKKKKEKERKRKKKETDVVIRNGSIAHIVGVAPFSPECASASNSGVLPCRERIKESHTYSRGTQTKSNISCKHVSSFETHAGGAADGEVGAPQYGAVLRRAFVLRATYVRRTKGIQTTHTADSSSISSTKSRTFSAQTKVWRETLGGPGDLRRARRARVGAAGKLRPVSIKNSVGVLRVAEPVSDEDDGEYSREPRDRREYVGTLDRNRIGRLKRTVVGSRFTKCKSRTVSWTQAGTRRCARERLGRAATSSPLFHRLSRRRSAARPSALARKICARDSRS